MSRMQTSNRLSVLAPVALLVAAVFITAQRGAADTTTPAATTPSDSAQRQRIDKLIEELGDDGYHIRRSAQEQLAKIGFDAFDALSEAENHEDPEIGVRARYLLRLLQVDFADKSDSPKVMEILEDYRSKSPREKLLKMDALAGLPQGEGLAALCRLVRFQRWELLSKHAAIAILQWRTDNPAMAQRLRPLFHSQLGCSRRASAQWLRGALQFSTEPTAAVTQWREFVARENDLLRRGDPRTDKQVVQVLMHHDIQWTFALKRSSEEKVAALGRLVTLRRKDKDAQILRPLITWLVEQEAWQAMGKQPAELADLFAANPRQSLYALAQALGKQGKAEAAEQAAGRALRLDCGDKEGQDAAHFETAYLLQKQGRFEWARREYRRCIDNGSVENELICLAYSYLAEMHHDQARETQAAAVLNTLVDRLKARRTQKKKEKTADGQKENLAEKARKLERQLTDFPGINIKSLQARRGYFLAQQHKAKGQTDKQRQCLEAALAADPSEIDVLIACYRLSDSTPEFRRKVKKLIRAATDHMRMQAVKHPRMMSWYNQLAWLVSNTEGDLDEALRFSKKSLQLQRDNGGYYDTLARCYYAQGDLKNAVKAQTRAAGLEPHSGLIAKQLKLFTEALAAEK